MKTYSAILVFILSIMLFYGCKKEAMVTDTEGNSIKGNWKVTAITLDSNVVLPGNDVIIISFHENKFNGNSSGVCGNSFSGDYIRQGSAIETNNLISTEAVCPESFYWQVFNIIQTGNRLELKDTLIIYNNQRNIKLYLIKL